jgi:hypothetical protein
MFYYLIDFAALEDISACLFFRCLLAPRIEFLVPMSYDRKLQTPQTCCLFLKSHSLTLILKSARLLFASSMIAFASGCKSRRSRVRKNGAVHRPKAKSDQTRHNQGPGLHALGREVHRIQEASVRSRAERPFLIAKHRFGHLGRRSTGLGKACACPTRPSPLPIS